ncbi:sodium:solute symporter family protein [Virgibacillus salexigens]|uniref:Pantothenate permease n=1 Tax=Virgibacillus massiliensis TaxID=1462526 RepID=A0A024Q8F1_9BACI|nr:sodium:solute symporter family protein [Virgibacillus massiliensis]CDQ38537.1 Pantothenate permease [Virgibacillus massiliensis]
MVWYSYYIIPIVYLIAMILVGVLVAKKQETRADFYVAGGKMNAGLLFSTIFSTVVGANTYMGFSGMVYHDGFSMMWLLVAAGSAYFVLFFISGKIRQIARHFEVFTLPDLMALRYSSSVAILTTLFSLVALVGGAGGSILGIGVILHSILGIDTTLAILITSVVTITYTAFGGLMGVALTDWIQSIIMVIGLILVIVFGLQALSPESTLMNATIIGSEVMQTVLGGNFMSLTESATFMMIMTWAITFLPLNTISQTQIQRVYSAKNVKTIQRISLLMVWFVALFMAFGLALVGGIGKALIPDISNAETIFPVLAMEVIHPWIGIIIVTGILGACMSTVDSNLLGAGIHVTRDIYEKNKQRLGKTINEKHTISITRWTLVTIGVLSTFAALWTPSIMELLLLTQKIFAGATFIPIILGLLWSRANTKGATTGILLGAGATIYCQIISSTIDPVIIGILFSLAGTIIASLISTEETEKGKQFIYKTINKKDMVFLSIILVGYIAFLVGVNFVNVWPTLIVITLIGLLIGVLLLIIYILPRKRKIGEEP